MTTVIVGSNNPSLYSMTDRVVRPDRIIPIQEVMKIAENDPIWSARGKAIQSYAVLEQSLSRALALLGGMTLEIAATIFYKITSTGSRNAILEKLIHKKHGQKFNLFWNSYFRELRTIDIKRHEIVHWLSATNAAFNDQHMLLVGVMLVPPTYWGADPTLPRLLTGDLTAFSEKCDVFSRLCVMFTGATDEEGDRPDPAIFAPWLEIFQQPLVYPLPMDHPINQMPVTPETQPQSPRG